VTVLKSASPSVRYPIPFSRAHTLFLCWPILVALSGALYWRSVSQSTSGFTEVMTLILCLLLALWVWREIMHQPQGDLFGPLMAPYGLWEWMAQGHAQAGELSVTWDAQSFILLKFQPVHPNEVDHFGSRSLVKRRRLRPTVWIWASQKAEPTKWEDFRRAVYASERVVG
jgi:hypothetical protein